MVITNSAKRLCLYIHHSTKNMNHVKRYIIDYNLMAINMPFHIINGKISFLLSISIIIQQTLLSV